MTQSHSLLLSHGLEDSLHLLPLLLGEVVGADPLLEELKAPLLLADPEQLLGAPLGGGESDHLSDEAPHKLVVFCHLSLGLARLNLEGVLGGLVTLFQTDTDFITGSHNNVSCRSESSNISL